MISPSYCGVHQRRRWRSVRIAPGKTLFTRRSEENTSELQSQSNLECRLLLEKKRVNNDSKQVWCFNIYRSTHGLTEMDYGTPISRPATQWTSRLGDLV